MKHAVTKCPSAATVSGEPGRLRPRVRPTLRQDHRDREGHQRHDQHRQPVRDEVLPTALRACGFVLRLRGCLFTQVGVTNDGALQCGTRARVAKHYRFRIGGSRSSQQAPGVR